VTTIAILASGNGSNAENIINCVKEQHPSLVVKLVISDHADAFVHQRAKRLAVPSITIPRTKKGVQGREEHERAILKVLAQHQIDWVVLAGHMRLLSPTFLKPYYDSALSAYRVVNIHPSLLPAFPGLDAYQQAFNAGVKVAGVTIHLVDHGMDSGPILLQQSFPRKRDDTLESFQARGMKVEYQLYRQFLSALANNQIKKSDQHFYLNEDCSK
jgi:phosphoribosylglycinamide formyltransferase 1